MPHRPALKADTREGVVSTMYLWLIMGFMLGLFVELAALGFTGLMNASLFVVFAIPFAIGVGCMALIWAVNRVFGVPGIVFASWTAGGIYAGMFVAGLILKLFVLWQFTMPILLAGMVAGLIAGMFLSLVRISSGDRDIFRP